MPHGLAPDGRRSHALFLGGVLVLASALVTLAWFGPGGCGSQRSVSSTQRPQRPASPLDEVEDRRGLLDAVADAPQPEQPAPRPVPPKSEPTVRIRIASVRGGGPVELSAPGGMLRLTPEGGGAPLASARTLSLARSGPGWSIRADGAAVTAGAAGSSAHAPMAAGARVAPPVLEVRAVSSVGAEMPISYAGARWPGVMRLHLRQDQDEGTIDLVAIVPMERYLPGVIAKELYRSWDVETYRAQAIAARSYAVCEAAYWADRRHFDMVAGEASQAWIGETTLPQAQQAVADTRGVLLLYEDRVVPAYYSSCCGGAAANAIDTVTRNPMHDIAPLSLGRSLQGVRPNCCRNAPTYTWTERIPADEAGRRVAAWARATGRPEAAQLRSIAAIETLRVTESGRPIAFRIVDDSGRAVELSSEQLRAALNTADPERSAGTGPPRRVRSGCFDATVSRGMIMLQGRGHGHGVGLCQYGAEAMARAGRSWRQILDRYYPGALPVRCW